MKDMQQHKAKFPRQSFKQFNIIPTCHQVHSPFITFSARALCNSIAMHKIFTIMPLFYINKQLKQ